MMTTPATPTETLDNILHALALGRADDRPTTDAERAIAARLEASVERAFTERGLVPPSHPPMPTRERSWWRRLWQWLVGVPPAPPALTIMANRS